MPYSPLSDKTNERYVPRTVYLDPDFEFKTRGESFGGKEDTNEAFYHKYTSKTPQFIKKLGRREVILKGALLAFCES